MERGDVAAVPAESHLERDLAPLGRDVRDPDGAW